MAERAAWKFVEENKTTFDLTVLNPDIVIGPMIHPIRGPKFVNESNRFVIYNFLDGTYKAVEDVRYPFYHFVGPSPKSLQVVREGQISQQWFPRWMFGMSPGRIFSP